MPGIPVDPSATGAILPIVPEDPPNNSAAAAEPGPGIPGPTTSTTTPFETAKMEKVDRQARSGHSCNPDDFLAILNRFPTAFACDGLALAPFESAYGDRHNDHSPGATFKRFKTGHFSQPGRSYVAQKVPVNRQLRPF